MQGTLYRCAGDAKTTVEVSAAVAEPVARGQTAVDGAESIPVSYPGFVEDMKRLGAQLRVE